MSNEKRCRAQLDVTWGGSADTLQCVKDEGHGAVYYSAKHPQGAHYPSEHRFIVEVEQPEPEPALATVVGAGS